ncbi:MAG: PDZ domain-containing protein [Anaerolineae bacterium]|nr:PDZ domain-containing protein [Phycisphaerae bacterium]
MNREKLAWSISLVLIATLAFSIPGTLAQRDDDYSFMRTLVDIHRQVASNYVDPVDESKLRQGAIDGMLGELDPFSVYVPPANQEAFDRLLEGSFKGVGIQLNQNENGQLEVITPIDGSPAAKAGMMAGDIILKVNGESIEGIRMPDVQKKIGGPLGTEVKMTVRHATGEEAELTMTREEIVLPTVKGYGRNQDNTWDYYVCDDPKIAYVRITQFTPDTFQTLAPVVGNLVQNGMRGLVLDLRFNPGGRLDQALQILDMLVDRGTLLVTKGRNRPESRIEATGSGALPWFPMIVLVNEHSASASEVVAGSLMDNKRALVLGQRSYGKGSVQEVIPLDSKSGELKLTVAYYYLPSGRLVHKKKDATDWGVQPQIVVPMDLETERKVFNEISNRELFRKPIKATTQATTGPTTQPLMIDVQLQRAVDTLIGSIVLEGASKEGKGGLGATLISPATAPSGTDRPRGGPMILPSSRPIVPEEPDSTAQPPDQLPSTQPAPKAAPPGEKPPVDSQTAPTPSPATAPATAPTTQP